jgi:hypothetical protein
MSETRSEKIEREQKEAYLENARLMYSFCRNIGLNKKESLTVAKLSLTVENLEYAWGKTGNNEEQFKNMVANWHLKIEKNRLESMQPK